MRRAVKVSFILFLVTVSACSEQADTPASLRSGASVLASRNPQPTAVNVTTTVYDADNSGGLFTQSDDYNGAGFASYAPISGVRGSLTSEVSADGGWKLFIGNQTVRTLHLLLADAGLPFPNGYYSSHVEAGSRCFDQAGDSLNILSQAAGAAYDNCTLIVDFAYGKTTYKLAMGPRFENTGRATITCTAAAGGSCSSWTITPNDLVANARVAILTSNTDTTSLDGRFYRNSFNITATR